MSTSEWSRAFVPTPSASPDAKSAELDVLAGDKDLGPVVHRLRGSSEHLVALKWGTPIMLFLGVALTLLIAFGDVTPQRPVRRGRRPVAATPIDNLLHDSRSWVAPFAFLFGLACAVQLVLVRAIRVQLHERGLAYRGATGRWAVRWEEIADVRASIVHVFGGAGPSLRGWVSMEIAGGRKLKLGATVEGLEHLGDIIREATFDHLYEPVEAEIEANRPVSFGPLLLRHDGLVKGGEFQPWSAIETAHVWEGKLEITVTGKRFAWFKTKTRDIQNVHVLVPAIEHFRFAS